MCVIVGGMFDFSCMGVDRTPSIAIGLQVVIPSNQGSLMSTVACNTHNPVYIRTRSKLFQSGQIPWKSINLHDSNEIQTETTT